MDPIDTALRVLIEQIYGECLDAIHAVETAKKELERQRRDGAIGALAVANDAFPRMLALRDAIMAVHTAT